MGASGMTMDDLIGALDTVYSRSEKVVRRVAAAQSMATKRWWTVVGREGRMWAKAWSQAGTHRFPVISLTVKGSLHDAKTFRYVTSQPHGRLTVIMNRGFMNIDVVLLASDAGIDLLAGRIESSN